MKQRQSTRRMMMTVLSAYMCAMASPALAKAHIQERYKATIDGQSFKVIKYDNGSVKVVDGGVFGDGRSYNLRDRMRRAVTIATGCQIADDFDIDGKLIGKLDCAAGDGVKGQ